MGFQSFTKAYTSGQYLCVPSVYAPAAATPLTVTGTAWQAFSSGTAATGGFTAPPSGSVMVTATYIVEEGTTGQDTWVSLALGGTVIPVTDAWSYSATTSPNPAVSVFLVSGLTPGSSCNLDLIGACGTAGDTVTILALGTTAVGTVRGGPLSVTTQAV